MVGEDLDLAVWGAEFESGSEASWGSDDDDTSREGSTSDDSTNQDDRLRSARSYEVLVKESSLQGNSSNKARRTPRAAKDTADPSAHVYGNIGSIMREPSEHGHRIPARVRFEQPHSKVSYAGFEHRSAQDDCVLLGSPRRYFRAKSIICLYLAAWNPF